LASSEAKVTTSAKPASQRVAQILNLRSIVKNLPQLRKTLEGSRSQLLRIVHDVSYGLIVTEFDAKVLLGVM